MTNSYDLCLSLTETSVFHMAGLCLRHKAVLHPDLHLDHQNYPPYLCLDKKNNPNKLTDDPMTQNNKLCIKPIA